MRYDPTDPVALTAALIRCPSVTPEEGGAIGLLESIFTAHGFTCTRIERGGISNLFAKRGQGGPVVAFNGHTDVVPVGDPDAWSADPFGAEIRDGVMYGRGAVDMKSGVAAWVSAALRVAGKGHPGTIVITVTGDEEGEATNGTRAILDWMTENGESADVCIVGEPTSLQTLGDTIKIGRRGSMTGYLTITGKQGHTAYPERALNPLPALSRICARLAGEELDQGTEHFQPSTLALATIDTGNQANNVIPASARAVFNVRFNDLHTSDSLRGWAEEVISQETEGTGLVANLEVKISGEAFLTPPGPLSEAVCNAVESATGRRPAMTTGGGTSDARFVKSLCPVVELGLVGSTMHQTDERVPIEEIRSLSRIYESLLMRLLTS